MDKKLLNALKENSKKLVKYTEAGAKWAKYVKEMKRYSPDEYRRMVMNEPLPPQPPESFN